jgi:G:T-mismatch repair DNA endonuclease (very short patch repair protein)
VSAKLTTADFIARATAQHKGRYSYARASYTNNNARITITCPAHGDFQQRASNHMLGIGCPRCKADKTSARQSDTSATFTRKATVVHGELYDYSGVQYTRSNQKVRIRCRIHGEFLQTPNAHIGTSPGKSSARPTGAGCPKCAGKAMTTEEFIGRARTTHGERYGYDRTDYALIKDAVTVTCPTHGDFQQAAEGHLAGRGCRQCWAESYASAGEGEVATWIESLGFAVQRNTRAALATRLEIDIFIPAANLGIEFNGCYWHSDKVEKNKRKHEFKHACANTDGIRLMTVWDTDWQHKQAIVKRQIAHALGATDDTPISARACDIAQITAMQANALYEVHHIQGACRGGVLSLGLTHAGELVAAMTFSKGSARRGITTEGEWELARYATAKLVRGGASKLFAAFVKASAPQTVWSFSDKQHFTGGIYKTLGFSDDASLPADYKVVHPSTLKTWHKSMWQRKSIPKRLRELGSTLTFDPATDPRTEHQMHDAAKVLRIWDAGKTRWVWHA